MGGWAVHVIEDVCAATDSAVQPEICVLGSRSGRTFLQFLSEDKFDSVEDPSADESGTRNGENPRPDDAASDTPANGGQAAGGFCGETAEWSQFGDALAHGLDDAPSAGHSAAAHGEMAANNDPVGN